MFAEGKHKKDCSLSRSICDILLACLRHNAQASAWAAQLVPGGVFAALNVGYVVENL